MVTVIQKRDFPFSTHLFITTHILDVNLSVDEVPYDPNRSDATQEYGVLPKYIKTPGRLIRSIKSNGPISLPAPSSTTLDIKLFHQNYKHLSTSSIPKNEFTINNKKFEQYPIYSGLNYFNDTFQTTRRDYDLNQQDQIMDLNNRFMAIADLNNHYDYINSPYDRANAGLYSNWNNSAMSNLWEFNLDDTILTPDEISRSKTLQELRNNPTIRNNPTLLYYYLYNRWAPLYQRHKRGFLVTSTSAGSSDRDDNLSRVFHYPMKKGDATISGPVWVPNDTPIGLSIIRIDDVKYGPRHDATEYHITEYLLNINPSARHNSGSQSGVVVVPIKPKTPSPYVPSTGIDSETTLPIHSILHKDVKYYQDFIQASQTDLGELFVGNDISVEQVERMLNLATYYVFNPRRNVNLDRRTQSEDYHFDTPNTPEINGYTRNRGPGNIFRLEGPNQSGPAGNVGFYDIDSIIGGRTGQTGSANTASPSTTASNINDISNTDRDLRYRENEFTFLGEFPVFDKNDINNKPLLRKKMDAYINWRTKNPSDDVSILPNPTTTSTWIKSRLMNTDLLRDRPKPISILGSFQHHDIERHDRVASTDRTNQDFTQNEYLYHDKPLSVTELIRTIKHVAKRYSGISKVQYGRSNLNKYEDFFFSTQNNDHLKNDIERRIDEMLAVSTVSGRDLLPGEEVSMQKVWDFLVSVANIIYTSVKRSNPLINTITVCHSSCHSNSSTGVPQYDTEWGWKNLRGSHGAWTADIYTRAVNKPGQPYYRGPWTYRRQDQSRSTDSREDYIHHLNNNFTAI